MKNGTLCALCFALISCGGGSAPQPAPPPAQQPPPRSLDYVMHENPGMPAYGLIAGNPLAIVFGGNIDDTLRGTNMIPIAPRLAEAGYAVAALTLPAHEPEANPSGLIGWAERIKAGETDLFTDFCRKVSQVIDHLAATRVTAVGISRGGYVAATCVARDSRFHALVMLAPVTDLTRLAEFSGVTVDQSIYGLDTATLSNHPVLVRIGKNDDRVSTDAATSFAGKVGATLQLLDVEGHSAPEDGSTLAWLRTH